MSKCNAVGTMGLHLTMCIVVNRKLTPPIHRPQRYHGCSQVLFMRLKRSWPSREAWHVPVTSRATKVGRGICNKRDKWCFIPRRTAYVKYCAPSPCSFRLKPSTYLFALEDRFLCWHVFVHYRSASTNNEAACRDWSAPRAFWGVSLTMVEGRVRPQPKQIRIWRWNLNAMTNSVAQECHETWCEALTILGQFLSLKYHGSQTMFWLRW